MALFSTFLSLDASLYPGSGSVTGAVLDLQEYPCEPPARMLAGTVQMVYWVDGPFSTGGGGPADAVGITLQSSPDNSTWTDEVSSSGSPASSDYAQALGVVTSGLRYWRANLTSASTSYPITAVLFAK
jgi:hypothetical protein